MVCLHSHSPFTAAPIPASSNEIIYNRLTLLTITIANSGQNIKASHLKALGEEPKAGRDKNITTSRKKETHLLRSTFIWRIFPMPMGIEDASSKGAVCLLVLGSQDQCSGGLRKVDLFVHGEAHKEESQRWGEGNIFLQTLKSLADSATHALGENPRSQWKATTGSLKELSRDVNSCCYGQTESLNWEEPGKQFEHSIEILEGPWLRNKKHMPKAKKAKNYAYWCWPYQIQIYSYKLLQLPKTIQA